MCFKAVFGGLINSCGLCSRTRFFSGQCEYNAILVHNREDHHLFHPPKLIFFRSNLQQSDFTFWYSGPLSSNDSKGKKVSAIIVIKYSEPRI